MPARQKNQTQKTPARKRAAKLRAEILSQPAWAMEPRALAELVQRLEMVSERGMAPAEGFAPRKSIASLGVASESANGYTKLGSLALIEVSGTIFSKDDWVTRWMGGTSQEALQANLARAKSDPEVSAVVIHFDSPGGTAQGNVETFEAIASLARTKPVYGFASYLCASAAYWLASACTAIGASCDATIGSVGILSIHVERSKQLAEMGIGVTIIRHGDNKCLENSLEPLSAKAREQAQQRIDAYGKLFDGAVSVGRQVPLEKVASQFGSGLCFMGHEAQGRQMIDHVCSWQEFLACARSGDFSAIQKAPAGAQAKTAVSSQAAGASAAGNVPTPPSSACGVALGGNQRSNQMNKIHAALFALGLVAADATPETVAAVTASYFKGKGQAQPPGEEATVAALFDSGSKPAASATQAATSAGSSTTTTTTTAGAAAPNVQAAHQSEFEEAKAAAAANERKRAKDLRASGRMMGVAEAEIEAAIDGNLSIEAAVQKWTSGPSKEPPVSGANVTVTGEGITRFHADCEAALLGRMGMTVPAAQATADVRRMQQMPLYNMALETLRRNNARIEDEWNREAVIRQALEVGSTPTAEGGGPFNRPGSFPYLLNGISQKVLDEGMDAAEVTYDQWCGYWAKPLPDFRPVPIVGKNALDRLDQIIDAQELKEFGLQEESLNYLAVARYGNTFKWTPEMMVQDDLDAFAEGLLGLSDAHETTLNQLCLLQIVGQGATLVDGYTLFNDTYHFNDISSGGAPSVQQWEAMQKKYWAQKTIGGKQYLRGRLAIALVPPTYDLAADQVFSAANPETKVAATDATVNKYRGKVQVVVEPELQRYSSTNWFGMKRPRGTMDATVIYAFQAGYGRGGKRERWYDWATKCWCVSIEGRFGAAAKQYRTAVRNAG